MQDVGKVRVLSALIEANYSVRAAAVRLRTSPSSIYRSIRRWQLTPPMFSRKAGGRVLRTDFVRRCEEIRLALEEENKSEQA